MSIIPSVVMKSHGVYGPCDLYSRLLKDRIIIISQEINEQISSVVVSQLLFLQSQDQKKPIYMYINSPGGSVTDGLAIIDTMNIISCPVYTYCIGSCASMGALICCSGNKGNRFILEHGRMMIHSVSCGASGDISFVKNQINQAEQLNNIIVDILLKTTGKSQKEIRKNIKEDHYMSAKQSIEYGLVDKILQK